MARRLWLSRDPITICRQRRRRRVREQDIAVGQHRFNEPAVINGVVLFQCRASAGEVIQRERFAFVDRRPQPRFFPPLLGHMVKVPILVIGPGDDALIVDRLLELGDGSLVPAAGLPKKGRQQMAINFESFTILPPTAPELPVRHSGPDFPSLYFSVERMPPSTSRTAFMDGSASPRLASTRRAISRTVNDSSATLSTCKTAGNIVPRRNQGLTRFRRLAEMRRRLKAGSYSWITASTCFMACARRAASSRFSLIRPPMSACSRTRYGTAG